MARATHAALRSLAAVAVLVALCCPAVACVAPESVEAAIRENNRDVDIRVLDELEASRLRVGISALIGQQVPQGGEYLLAHVPGAATSYVVRFEEGCATHHGRFSQGLIQTWLEGSPA